MTYNEAIKSADYLTITTDKEKEYSGWFTNGRVERGSLPNGVYKYDLIENLDGDNPLYLFCGIRNGNVLVNFGGTFLTDQWIEELPNTGDEAVIDDHAPAWDYSFT